ncbi:MAG: TerC family protein [Acidimicrobiia bacterium]|nr:TerC family protein [Acidimicrobiia bacterium]
MNNPILFPFEQYWWFYAAFTLFVLAMLALDLGLFHRKSHKITLRESTIWTIVWIALAGIFNAGLYFWASSQVGPEAARTVSLEFLAGYLIEKALSVDNIFVFVVVFSYFNIPGLYHHRVLFYGILGALVFRALFIAAGAALFQYHIVVWIFGILLIVTGVKMMIKPEKHVEPDKNPMVRLFRRFIPVTDELQGERMLVYRHGRYWATPLLLCLFFVEFTDVIFALDSVPAIFALTREPLIVFTSNIFAILGLRSLYFVLAGAVEKFHLIHYGLSLVLVFVGLKMVWLNPAFDGKFPIGISLAIIATLIGGSAGLSLLFPKKETEPLVTRQDEAA